MEFLCLAQCEGLGGAYARKAGLLFPGACFLKKEAGRRLVKTTLEVVITWPKLSTEYSFEQWLFASLGCIASTLGLE